MGVRWGGESKPRRAYDVRNHSLPGQICGKAWHLEKPRAEWPQGARGAAVPHLGERSLIA